MKSTTRTVLVPRPRTAPVGGEAVRDLALLEWARTVVTDVLAEPAAAASVS